MSGLLLDTHVLLWWLDDDARLGHAARQTIAASDNRVMVSAATVWEIAIMQAIGKLDAPPDLVAGLSDEGFDPLPIEFAHAERAGSLPPLHRDPFDRMLIAQAEIESLDLLSADDAVLRYQTRVIDASR